MVNKQIVDIKNSGEKSDPPPELIPLGVQSERTNLKSNLKDDSQAINEATTVDIAYNILVQKMIDELHNDPLSVLSSSRVFRKQPSYSRILRLGKRIVPLLIKDLRDKPASVSGYALDLLSDLLPDVDLVQIYDDEKIKFYSEIERLYWLRWWDDRGSKMMWPPQL